jgi:WXG100 family type VII secretion target
MSFMKAGIDDFRKMRDDYKTHSDHIDQMVKYLDGSLRSSIWQGQAQSRFEGDWNSIHKPNLLKLRQALQDLSKELESRRQWTEEFENAGARKA